MADEELDRVIQETVERDLNPVRFGTWERLMAWLILVFAIVSAAASVLTLAVTW